MGEFINRGNIIDMAVGVIIGGAFQKIIVSMVGDIVMSSISIITGGINFTKCSMVLGSNENSPFLYYGNFITAVTNFFLMELVIFVVIKTMNNFSSKLKPKVEIVEVVTTKICPYCLSEVSHAATRCSWYPSYFEESK